MNTVLRIAFALILPQAFWLSEVAGSRAQAQTPPAAQPEATTAARPPQSEGTETPNTVYSLQAGDEIQIRVFNLPELDQIVKVRPDGKISLLLLNDVVAAGSAPEDLSKKLTEEYGKFFRTPRVTTIVRTFTNRDVFVGGEVVQPRMVVLTGKMTAIAAIFYAGGFKNTAKTKEVIVLHKTPTGAAAIDRVNVEAVLHRGEGDIDLSPFDVVYVPKSRIARLDQFVDQYMKQLMPIATSMGFSYILGGQGFAISIP